MNFRIKIIHPIGILMFFSCMFMCSKSNGGTTDSLKIISYNVMNYGIGASKSCPGLLTFKQHEYLRTILKYDEPDILGLVKMTAIPSSFTSDTVIDKVLDSVCYHCYGHSDYTKISSYYKANMLYFKTDKIGYISTTYLYSDSSIADINLHKLYYKAADLATTHDTQFINIILIHNLSGSGSSIQRNTEMTGVVSYLQKHFTSLDNFIFMGDFNTASIYEKTYQFLINPADTNFKFYDPINKTSDWANNPSDYAMFLTQSTRATSLPDCGSSGAMTEVFDHVFPSGSLMYGTDSLKYVPGSYKVIGQDGNHVGLALTDKPKNKIVPSAVLNALYNMSNHLPVEIKLAVSNPPVVNGIESKEISNSISTWMNSGKLHITLKENDPLLNDKCSIILYDIHGNEIYSNSTFLKTSNSIDVSSISQGTYILNILSDGGKMYSKKIIAMH